MIQLSRVTWPTKGIASPGPGLTLVKMALQLHEAFNFAQMLQGERPGTKGWTLPFKRWAIHRTDGAIHRTSWARSTETRWCVYNLSIYIYTVYIYYPNMIIWLEALRPGTSSSAAHMHFQIYTYIRTTTCQECKTNTVADGIRWQYDKVFGGLRCFFHVPSNKWDDDPHWRAYFSRLKPSVNQLISFFGLKLTEVAVNGYHHTSMPTTQMRPGSSPRENARLSGTCLRMWRSFRRRGSQGQGRDPGNLWESIWESNWVDWNVPSLQNVIRMFNQSDMGWFSNNFPRG